MLRLNLCSTGLCWACSMGPSCGTDSYACCLSCHTSSACCLNATAIALPPGLQTASLFDFVSRLQDGTLHSVKSLEMSKRSPSEAPDVMPGMERNGRPEDSAHGSKLDQTVT